MKGLSVLAPTAKRLEGKVAVITGGASGIGKSTAKLFAQHGAKVVIADIQDDLGHSICQETKGGISYVHCDVTKERDVENAVDAAVTKHGKLDIFFSNAGIAGEIDTAISSSGYENFRKVMDTNLYGAFLAGKHASRVMVPAKRGSIIYTASVLGVIAGNSPYAYSVSKAAIIGLTKNLCVEMGQFGVRVNCFSPYGVPTPLFCEALESTDRKAVMAMTAAKATLKGVMLEEQDIAEAALYLGSDASKYVSGLNLLVDGGYTTTNGGLAGLTNRLA